MKPFSFDNTEAGFLKRSRKTVNYMNSVLWGLGPMPQLAVDNEEAIDYRVFRGSVVDVSDEDLGDMNDQVHRCLMALTDGESFELVVGSGDG